MRSTAMRPLLTLALTVPLAAATPGAAATVGDLRGNHRIVLVAAATAADPRLARQRQVLAGWRQGAADRDVGVVEVIGDAVVGADDRAALLRRAYRLPAGRFAAILIGKDGHVALRSADVIPAATLEATIDAMPMRRAGER